MAVRLRHPELRDVTFVVLHYRPLTEPWLCPKCNMLHETKAYHLALDSSGEITVSDEVYERLAELKNLPLVKVGKDPFPKAQAMLIPDASGRVEGPHLENLPKRLDEAVARAKYVRSLKTVIARSERT
jgi:hypothetical protein